jgi:hypothetical protein
LNTSEEEKVEGKGSCFWKHNDVHAIIQKSIIQVVDRQDCLIEECSCAGAILDLEYNNNSQNMP